jgi:hypothetical protein
LWTPYARLAHVESATRGYTHDAAHRRTLDAEEARLAARWSAWIESDPAYNPNLTRHGRAFALGAASAIRECELRVTPQACEILPPA